MKDIRMPESSSVESRSEENPGHFSPADRFGRYTMLEQLGTSETEAIWAAYDPHLNRKVVLKLVQGNQAEQEQLRNRFIQGARSLAQLSHPNVASVFEVDEVDGQLYSAIEYIEGEAINNWIQRVSPTLDEILDVYVAAGQGLAAAHRQGIIHQEVSPSNIVIGADKRVRVLNFRLGKENDDTSITEKSDLNKSILDAEPVPGHRESPLLGVDATLSRYAAPEQRDMKSAVGPAADQFSLAMSFHESLYGYLPVEQGAERGAFERRSLAHLQVTLKKALQPDPTDRHASMDRFIAMLQKKASVWQGRVRLGLVAAIGLGISGTIWINQVSEAPSTDLPCQGAGTIWQGVWNEERSANIESAFASAQALGSEHAAKWVTKEMAEYGDVWTKTWTDICTLTHVDELQSQEELEVRMSCLAEQRRRVDTVLRLLEHPDEKFVASSSRIISSFEDPTLCRNVVLPSDAVTLGETPVIRAKLVEAKSKLYMALALLYTGGFEEAVALAEEAERVGRNYGDSGLVSWAMTMRGVAVSQSDFDAGHAIIKQSILLAAEAGDRYRERSAWALLFNDMYGKYRGSEDFKVWGGVLLGLESTTNAGLRENTLPRSVEADLALAKGEYIAEVGTLSRAKLYLQEVLSSAFVRPLSKVRAELELGIIAYYTGDFLLAEESFSAAVVATAEEYGKDYINVLVRLSGLSQVYFEAGNFALARKASLAALARDPSEVKSHVGKHLRHRLRLVLTELYLGNVDFAYAEILDIRARVSEETPLDVRHESLWILGEVEHHRGNSVLAKRLIQQSIDDYNASGRASANLLGPLKVGLCMVVAKLDPNEALIVCKDAEDTLRDYLEGPSLDSLNVHRSYATIYKELGRIEDEQNERAKIEKIERYLATVRSKMQGPPTL